MENKIVAEAIELSKEELVSILGTEYIGTTKCIYCGSSDIVATKSIPPICLCNKCGRIWEAGEDGGTSGTCMVNCAPGCKSRCLSGGKK